MIGGKKVAGILTEMSAEMDSVRYMVLGVGLNVNQTDSDFPKSLEALATSLRRESGLGYDRASLAVKVLDELDHDYQRVCQGHFEAVADEWEQHCNTLGKSVRIQVGDRVIQGRAESLDGEGALLLRTNYGSLERIIGGDVTILK